MSKSLLLPLTFLKFWYFDAPLEMVGFLASLNKYVMQLLALPLCLKTFFKPLKNEYREGLVGFSRGLGMLIKTGLIIADLFIVFILIAFEFSVFISFLIFPVVTIMLMLLFI